MTLPLDHLETLAREATAALDEPDPARDPRAVAFLSEVTPDVVLALVAEVRRLRRVEEAAKALFDWKSDVIPTRLWTDLAAALTGSEP